MKVAGVSAAWDALTHSKAPSVLSHQESRHRETDLGNTFFSSFTNSDPGFNISFYKIHGNTGVDGAGRRKSGALLRPAFRGWVKSFPADARRRLPREGAGPRLI